MASSKVVLEGAVDSDAATLKSAAHGMHTGVECGTGVSLYYC